MKIQIEHVIYATVLLVLVAACPIRARVGSEYLEWADGQFQIPVEISGLKNASELEPYLNSQSEFVRMAAVRRLYQIAGSGASEFLRQLIRNEGSPKGPDYVPLVKLEAIRSLGLMTGNKGRIALLGVLSDYWGRIDNANKSSAFLNYDFAPVMSLLSDVLFSRIAHRDVFAAVESVAVSAPITDPGILPERVRQKIMKVYLKGRI